MDKKRFKCELPDCTATFSKRTKLIIHIRNHIGEKPFSCEIDGCTKKYASNSHLRRHIETAHKRNENGNLIKNLCKQCGKFMQSATVLKRHIQVMHCPISSLPFTCDICHTGFRRKPQYDFHMSQHSGKLPHACKECSKSFLVQSLLIRHQITHRKPETKLKWECDCGEKFLNVTALEKHQKESHDKRYQCDICNKFVYNLKQHQKTHSEEILHICTFENCQKSYKQKRNLNVHIQQAHSNRKFPCTYEGCDASLSTKQKLMNHINAIHLKIKPETPKEPKTTKRKRRKDLGSMQRSSAATLSGLDKILPIQVQKDIIEQKKSVEEIKNIINESLCEVDSNEGHNSTDDNIIE